MSQASGRFRTPRPVGKTLAMIAKARGVHVVNVVRRAAGAAELAALGIDNSGVDRGCRLAEAGRGDDGRSADRRRARFGGREESGQLPHLLGEGGLFMTFGAIANEPMISF